MKKISKIVFIFLMFSIFLGITSCSKKKVITHTVNFDSSGGNFIENITVEDGKTITDLPTPVKEHYQFLGWFCNDSILTTETKVNNDISVIAKWELIPFVDFYIDGSDTLDDGIATRLYIRYANDSTKVEVEWSIEDETIIEFMSTSKNMCRIQALKPGKTTIKATSIENKNDYAEIEITIKPAEYQITYDLSEEDKILLPSDAVSLISTGNYPITLPTLSKDRYVFNGWRINNSSETYMIIDENNQIENDIILTPSWIYPYLDAYFVNSNCVLGINEQSKIECAAFNIPSEYAKNEFTFLSLDDSIASVDEDGTVTGKKNGYTTILINLKSKDSINVSLGVTVDDAKNDFDEILTYFINNQPKVMTKKIDVYGWQKQYTYDLTTSVTKYLFEEYQVIENIAPLKNENRDGRTADKYYICIHDTGDAAYSAQQWSNVVYTNQNDGKKYGASYQYVVGNDGIYHNIPDNEIAYHAGDGTKNPYELFATGVKDDGIKPVVTIINKSGIAYFAINNKITSVPAPVVPGKSALTTEDINDAGVRCVIKNGEYYLGKTYYNDTYNKIANYGGNVNSIGIETCINEGSNIFYTWQKLAKLVAHLLLQNNLTVDDIVPHHYFSGKNCPQTIRSADMWDYVISMIEEEYTILKYINSGYTISLTSYSPEILNNEGRIISTPRYSTIVKYQIIVTKGDFSQSVVMSSTIPGYATI